MRDPNRASIQRQDVRVVLGLTGVGDDPVERPLDPTGAEGVAADHEGRASRLFFGPDSATLLGVLYFTGRGPIVPRAIFGEGCEGELLQVRRIVYSSQGYALGEPLWLQGDDEGFDPDFLFQFDEGLCHINLGDSGVMYVFGRSIVWQCH